LAFIATPLGLVLAAVAVTLGAVKSAFSSSEEGQNKFNKIVLIGSTLIGNFNDLLADFGEKVIEVFEDPQQAVKDFSKLIQENIINRFNGLIELVPALGKSIGQLFKGNFAEAGKIAADATAKVALGVENITDKTKGAIESTKAFIEEQKKEAALAGDVADMRAKADIIERDLKVARAMAESEVSELRLKARKEDEFSAAERKKFLIEANKVQNELLDAETEYLALRKDAQVLENTFSRTNKENKDLEADAIAALSQIESKRFTEQRQLQRELNTVNNQIKTDDKARAAQKKKFTEDEIKAEQERVEAVIQGYEDERALIDTVAESKKTMAVINIANAEEQAEAIAFIEREALNAKLMSLDDETAAYTAAAGMVGAVDEVKYAKQLEQIAALEAEKATMDRAAKVEAFTRDVEALGIKEQLELQSAELSIDNEEDLETKKQEIALKTANLRLALLKAFASEDGIITDKEKAELGDIEVVIDRLQKKLSGGGKDGVPSLAEALGLTEDELAAAIGVAEAIASTITGVLQIAMDANNQRIDGIDRRSQAEINAIEKSTLSEKSKKEKISAIEKKAAMEKYKIDLKNFKLSKALQITNAIIGTAQAAIAAYSSGAAVPIAGIALGPLMAGIAAGFGAIQIGMIASQQPPSPPAFARGGFVSGAGTGTSDSIDAKLSHGESVNNAKTTAMFPREISAMNAAGGGVDWYKGQGFSQGGLVQKFAAGGIAQASNSVLMGNESTNAIQQTIMNTPNVLVLEDFQNVQGRQIRVAENLET
jgi:hypothetical protein